MVSVEPSVKFSYNLIRGSVKSRQEFVSGLNNKIFNFLLPAFAKRKVDINYLDKIYTPLLPEPKYVKIKKLDNVNRNIVQGLSDYIEECGKFKGLTIELSTKKSKVKNTDFITFMHENTHVLDVLSNPKYTARIKKLNCFDERYTPVNDWFDNVMYHEEDIQNLATKKQLIKSIYKKTEKAIKNLSRIEKIDILQDSRYTLEQEYNAYEEQLKYAKILFKMKRPVDDLDLKDYSKKYMFKEKLSILKNIIYKLIQEERMEHRKVIINKHKKLLA